MSHPSKKIEIRNPRPDILGRVTHLLKSFLALVGLCALTIGSPATPSPPNIIFILVDDMGYLDIGCYGGEVQTPNIDRLAENGLRFTSMYNTSKCFPSRASLLTGVYAQQCNMGRNPRGGIQNAITIAELLKPQGYRTLAVGKHHSTVSLFDRGFDRFFGFHYGPGKSCANHFNPGLQRPGEGVPARKNGETRAYCFDDQKALPYYTPKDKDWYTTDAFTDWAINFLDEYKFEDTCPTPPPTTLFTLGLKTSQNTTAYMRWVTRRYERPALNAKSRSAFSQKTRRYPNPRTGLGTH